MTNEPIEDANRQLTKPDEKNADGIETICGLVNLILVVACIVFAAVTLTLAGEKRLIEPHHRPQAYFEQSIIPVVDEDGVVHKIYDSPFGFNHGELIKSIDHHMLVYWMKEPGRPKLIHAKSSCCRCAEIKVQRKKFNENLEKWLDNNMVLQLKN